jgi:D-alanyl-D-alanine carboxypeptidase (penicillin-binding protein 5/6)
MRNRLIFSLGVALFLGFGTEAFSKNGRVRKALPPDSESRAETAATFPGPDDSQSNSTVARTPQASLGRSSYPDDAPPTVASSVMMIDAKSGAVLFYKNPDIRRPVASTQKLLTAILIAEHGGLDETVRVAPVDCAVEPTKLEFRPGEAYLKRDILAAMLVHSCNDAAACLARNDAGSVSDFAQRMNAKAAELGALNSHFVNPNGLPRANQYSTARDMARIAYAAYRIGVLRQYMRLPGLIFTYASGKRRFLEPTNRLLTRSTMFTGMKTGYTDASGRCLISSATNGDKEIILVQLGGTHRPLFDDAQNLLIWGLGRTSNAEAGKVRMPKCEFRTEEIRTSKFALPYGLPMTT